MEPGERIEIKLRKLSQRHCFFLAIGCLLQIVFQPYHPSPLLDLPPLFIATAPTAGERLHPTWKCKLFLCARSREVANRRHAIVLVPSGMKRNRATKPLPPAQPLFQVNMHAYSSH
jgi:hypothetical protein